MFTCYIKIYRGFISYRTTTLFATTLSSVLSASTLIKMIRLPCWCGTRGESWESIAPRLRSMYATTKGRCHQRYKTGVIVDPQLFYKRLTPIHSSYKDIIFTIETDHSLLACVPHVLQCPWWQESSTTNLQLNHGQLHRDHFNPS